MGGQSSETFSATGQMWIPRQTRSGTNTDLDIGFRFLAADPSRQELSLGNSTADLSTVDSATLGGSALSLAQLGLTPSPSGRSDRDSLELVNDIDEPDELQPIIESVAAARWPVVAKVISLAMPAFGFFIVFWWLEICYMWRARRVVDALALLRGRSQEISAAYSLLLMVGREVFGVPANVTEVHRWDEVLREVGGEVTDFYLALRCPSSEVMRCATIGEMVESLWYPTGVEAATVEETLLWIHALTYFLIVRVSGVNDSYAAARLESGRTAFICLLAAMSVVVLVLCALVQRRLHSGLGSLFIWPGPYFNRARPTRELLSAVLDLEMLPSTALIVTVLEDGVICNVSDSARKLAGRAAFEMVGGRFDSFFREVDGRRLELVGAIDSHKARRSFTFVCRELEFVRKYVLLVEEAREANRQLVDARALSRLQPQIPRPFLEAFGRSGQRRWVFERPLLMVLRVGGGIEPAAFDQLFGVVNVTTQNFTRVFLVACEGHFIVFVADAEQPSVALFFIRDLVSDAVASLRRRPDLICEAAVIARREQVVFTLRVEPSPAIKSDCEWADLEAESLGCAPGSVLLAADVASGLRIGGQGGRFATLALSDLLRDGFVAELREPG
jgi:PAS domain-containing protein